MHDTNTDTGTTRHNVRQNNINRSASAEMRGRTAAAVLPVPKPSHATAPAIPTVAPIDLPARRCPIHAQGSGAKALAATSSTAPVSSSWHRPATRQAGTSWVQTGVLVLQGAQASRSAAQPGLVSCGSPASSRRGLRSVCSSSAYRRRPRGRPPPTELAHGVRSAARAARAPAPSSSGPRAARRSEEAFHRRV